MTGVFFADIVLGAACKPSLLSFTWLSPAMTVTRNKIIFLFSQLPLISRYWITFCREDVLRGAKTVTLPHRECTEFYATLFLGEQMHGYQGTKFAACITCAIIKFTLVLCGCVVVCFKDKTAHVICFFNTPKKPPTIFFIATLVNKVQALAKKKPETHTV